MSIDLDSVKESADRVRRKLNGESLAPIYADHPGGCSQFNEDIVHLARWAVSLSDPTPLSELSDEQWRELGFTLMEADGFNSSWDSKVNRFDVSFDVDLKTLDVDDLGGTDGFSVEAPTLGKLRHLIAALS